MTAKNKTISYLSGFAGILVAASAHADPVCNTVAECEQLITAAQARIQELQPAPQLGPIVRNEDGSVRRMIHGEAVSYCSTRGGLPTAKQLALALNPRGVGDTPREGFYSVSPENEASFYYNSDTYGPPSGDVRREWFWSSSVYYDFSAYVFTGYSGDIGYVSQYTYGGAVRCAGR